MREILVVFCILLSSLSYAQESEKIERSCNEFGVSVGLAIPMGDFANKDAGRSSAGLASTGYRIQIKYQHHFTDNFGLNFLVRNQAHEVESALLAAELEEDFPMYDYRINIKSWRINSFLLGMFYSFPLNEEKDLFLDMKLSAGISVTKSPRAQTTIISGSYTETVTQLSATDQAFGFLVGTGIKYYLKEDLGLSLSADLLSTNPDFDEILVSYQNSSGDHDLEDFNTDQSIGTFNIGLGVLFLF